MRRLLANNTVLLATAGIFFVIGLAISIRFHDFSWFARCGALITFVGIILISRPSITKEELRLNITMDTGLSMLDPEHYRRISEPVPEWLVNDLKSRSAVGLYGPIVTLVGTIVWGFGDLLNFAFAVSG